MMVIRRSLRHNKAGLIARDRVGQEGHVANNHTPVKKAMEKLTADIVAWRRPHKLQMMSYLFGE